MKTRTRDGTWAGDSDGHRPASNAYTGRKTSRLQDYVVG